MGIFSRKRDKAIPEALPNSNITPPRSFSSSDLVSNGALSPNSPDSRDGSTTADSAASPGGFTTLSEKCV